MTVQERINAMNNKIANDRVIEKEKELLEKQELNRAIEEVSKLFDRVWDIIQLGKYCIDNNIKFPKGKYHHFDYYYDDFKCDGIRHYFGFIGVDGICSKGKDIHVGWNNGGFCGVWDVHCDGRRLWLQHEGDQKNKKDVDSVNIVKRFIIDFEEFEKNFYEWFDKECKK